MMPVSTTDLAFPAPVVVLTFLGTCCLLGLSLLAAVIAVWRRAPRLGFFFLGCAAVLSLGYAGVLGLASAGSEDRVLPQGGAKYLCELDCHLAYSVADAEFRDGGATGRELVVHLAVRFDSETTSPTRGDAPLRPNARLVSVVDAAGRRYDPSVSATRRYREAGDAGATLSDALRPGQSLVVPLVFEVPEGIEAPVLWITGGEWVNRLLIGHERSPGHGRVYLALEARGRRSPAAVGMGMSDGRVYPQRRQGDGPRPAR